MCDRIDYSLNDFQKDCLRTTNRKLDWTQTVTNCVFGIVGESGEVADHFKKHWFQGHVLDVEKVKLEIADVMFYCAWLSDTLGFDLADVGESVIEKLRKRYGDSFSVEKSLNRKD